MRNPKKKPSRELGKCFLALIIVASIVAMRHVHSNLIYSLFFDRSRCQPLSEVNSPKGKNSRLINEIVKPGTLFCDTYHVESGTSIRVLTNEKIKIIAPREEFFMEEGSEYISQETGKYIVQFGFPSGSPKRYSINILTEGNEEYADINLDDSASKPAENYSINTRVDEQSPSSVGSTYNANESVPFSFEDKSLKVTDEALQAILERALLSLHDQSIPTESISLSLIDLRGSECCAYAGIRDELMQYPASIVKLFWLVALYGKYEGGILTPGDPISGETERLMAHDSSNSAASDILDAITGTTSGHALEPETLQKWVNARNEVNLYFERAGYQKININQKTFPIPDMDTPEGRDLQIRDFHNENFGGSLPVRNYLTTFETSRLLYEIEKGLAISPDYSQKVKDYLKHDHNPENWKDKPFNSIEGFFGEFLPQDVELFTKIGYTQEFGRQEAAIIKGDNVHFILVVFASDPIFSSEDSKGLSLLAKAVYDLMSERAI